MTKNTRQQCPGYIINRFPARSDSAPPALDDARAVPVNELYSVKFDSLGSLSRPSIEGGICQSTAGYPTTTAQNNLCTPPPVLSANTHPAAADGSAAAAAAAVRVAPATSSNAGGVESGSCGAGASAVKVIVGVSGVLLSAQE